jgi:hypothetical protein
MPKRGIDAHSRVFFDELVGLAASRLRATGAIRMEDRQGVIAFADHTAVNAANASASPIRNSPMAARGAISSVLGAAAEKRSSGSSMMRRAA